MHILSIHALTPMHDVHFYVIGRRGKGGGGGGGAGRQAGKQADELLTQKKNEVGFDL